ncbi:DUF5134 domain-containing protein [Prauserella cavernicola]|uniref:DUF5134 domain-containing protein n=1 Tax=Prauserella cavernicola TaxID=2800127 RepID=A0A934QSW3_9PSEU|nr:DUF5134 domain-containing protein [Prauserella cavernicola]MBK1787642.1 DUF5134 domain-containing protein [Prauserella cavernicola]
MIGSPVLAWLLTALFAATTAWCLRVLPSLGAWARVDAGWHALMGAAMIAMIWHWGMAIPLAPQVVLFALGCLWFLSRTAAGHSHSGGHTAPRGAGAHHAMMMAAMAWMVATMPELMAGSDPDSGGGHHHALGDAVSLSQSPASSPTALIAGHVALGLGFVALCLPWLARAFALGRHLPDPRSPAPGREVADCACHGAMSFGMGVMFLAMLAG